MSDVGKPTGLVKRKGSNAYYCRLRYPLDVAKQIGRTEFVRTLGTGIYAEALRKLPTARADFDFEVATIRCRVTGIRPRAAVLVRPKTGQNLTGTMVADLARRHFAAALIRLDREALPVRRAEEWQGCVDHAEADLATLSDPEDPNVARWTEAEEVRLLSADQLQAEPTSDESLLLREYLRRSLLEVARLRHARLHGDFGDQIADGFFQRRAGAELSASVPAHHATFKQVCDLFETEHKAEEVSSKTLLKSKAALAVMLRFFGSDTLVHRIDRQKCFAFRDLLTQLPPNMAKKGLAESDPAILARKNEAAGGAALSRETQSFYLSVLRRVLATAKDRRFVQDNEAVGIKPQGKAKRKEIARDPYSGAQLQRIFNAPIFRGCQDDERGFAVPGPNVPRRSRFWLPLIALFSGLRMNEVLQLTAEHVMFDNGGEPYLFISPDMQVKSENGYRRVPIHPELLRIGFMELVDDAKKRPGKLLFDDVPPGPDGYASSVFSKRYATFLRSLKLEEAGRKVTFHSFRHNFRDALRRNENNPDLVRELCGHSRGSEVSTSYGEGAPAHVLRPMVEAIDYGLDLRHIYQAAKGTTATGCKK